STTSIPPQQDVGTARVYSPPQEATLQPQPREAYTDDAPQQTNEAEDTVFHAKHKPDETD
ncbi:MAG: hypothetical protein AAGJ35_14845, partial [Myxococcota bacterium]